MWIKIAAVTLALSLILSGCGFVSMKGAPPVVVNDDVVPEPPMPDILENKKAFYIAPDVSVDLFQFELLQYNIDSSDFIYSYESEQMVTEMVDDKLVTYAPIAPEGSITKIVRIVSYNYKTKAYKVIFEAVSPNATTDKSLLAHMEKDMLYFCYDDTLYRYRLRKGSWEGKEGINLLEIYEPALVYDEFFCFDDTDMGEPISPNQIKLVEMIPIDSQNTVFLKFKLSRNDTTAWRYLFVMCEDGTVYVPRFIDGFATDVQLLQLNRSLLFAYNDLDYQPPDEEFYKLSIIGYLVDVNEFINAPDPEEYLPEPVLDLKFSDTDKGRQSKAENQVASFISDYRGVSYTQSTPGLAQYQVYSFPMSSKVNFTILSLEGGKDLHFRARSSSLNKLELDVTPTADNSFVTLKENFYYCSSDGITRVKNSKKLPETLVRPGVYYYLLPSTSSTDRAIAVGFETETAPPAHNIYSSAPFYHMAEAQIVELTIQP